MIVTNIQLQSTPKGTELSADVTFESVPDSHRKVWFRSEPGSLEPSISGDPFFSGFFIPAMALGEDLRIDGLVTPELIEAATQRVQPILLRWHPHYRAPKVTTSGALPPSSGDKDGVGCTFSGGLDSCYTLMKHRDEITHLLHCQGFVRPENLSFIGYEENIRKIARTQAEKCGMKFLGLRTNLTEVGSAGVISGLFKTGRPVHATFQRYVYFVSELVTFAYMFAPSLRGFFIPNSCPYERIAHTGSNPLIDPAWSTPGLRFIHDGAEADRTDKIEAIFRNDPDMLKRLHVCNARSSRGDNCNVCEKCLRTRVSLALVGYREQESSLRVPVDLDEVRYLDVSSEPMWWDNLLDAAQRRGNLEMATAIEVALGRRFDWRRSRSNFATSIRLSRSGQGRRILRKRFRDAYREGRARLLTSI